jgi:hypothetical protein
MTVHRVWVLDISQPTVWAAIEKEGLKKMKRIKSGCRIFRWAHRLTPCRKIACCKADGRDRRVLADSDYSFRAGNNSG